MFCDVPEYGDKVSLIPNTSIQFLDIEISSKSLSLGNVAFYVAEPDSESDEDTQIEFLSREINNAEYDEADELSDEYQRVQTDTIRNILKTVEGMWLPLPFLKVGSGSIGPSNWVRGQFVKLDGANNCDYRLILAIDTTLAISEHGSYTSPVQNDVNMGDADRNTTFKIHSGESLIAYSQQEWVSMWVDECYESYCSGLKRKVVQTTRERIFKAKLNYLALIHYLNGKPNKSSTPTIPELYFIQVGKAALNKKPKDVDLVLDIGHSRTCGLLIEGDNQNHNNLLNSHKLLLRDLTKPCQIYSDSFETRLEFSKGNFGSEFLSRKSGLRYPRGAFFWPSICRVGSEARHLSFNVPSGHGKTGFLNPKKYLWDAEASDQPWHFSSVNNEANKVLKSSKFASYLNANGFQSTLISETTTGSDYSRSSMMMFFISEIVFQAICQINSVLYRLNKGESNSRRALRNIILTIPSLMPKQEVTLFRARVRDALDIIWRILDWDEEQPNIVMKWNESACTQATYLCAEVAGKFHGNRDVFLDLIGKERNCEIQESGEDIVLGERKSIRIASLEIGAGSTVLSITKYFAGRGNNLLTSKVEFCDRFSAGGADILKKVIENVVLPAFIHCLETSFDISVTEKLKEYFSSNTIGESDIQKKARLAFSTQILQEVAIQALKLHEELPDANKGDIKLLSLSDVFSIANMPAVNTLNYLIKLNEEVDLLMFELPIDMFELADAIYKTLQAQITTFSEVIHKYDCDVLLVSGGITSAKALQRLILNKHPVGLSRVEFMHGYRVGPWYPYRNKQTETLYDPKTTVVVGASVLQQSKEKNIPGLALDVVDFKPASIIRNIGVMDGVMAVSEKNLIFKEIEPGKTELPVDTTFVLNTRCLLGFQQIKLGRWPVSPFYSIEFRNKSVASKYSQGALITLELDADSPNAGEDDYLIPSGFKLSIIEVENIAGGDGEIEDIVLKPRSIRFPSRVADTNFDWEETGVFKVQKNSQLDKRVAETCYAK
jgi:hypothetical protein